MNETAVADLAALAAHLRGELENKKYILIYAYNGTGKTRLTMAFKDIGKQDDARDTLYFNAFTEDLFTWDNDLEGDSDRKLKINRDSHFFDGLAELEMETRIRPLLQRYVDFDFRIDTDEWVVRFSPKGGGTDDLGIKVSRGEENLFIWCFFLAIVQLVMDGAEAYDWVKYIYIDDPISSLDDNNAIAVASDGATAEEQGKPGPLGDLLASRPVFQRDAQRTGCAKVEKDGILFLISAKKRCRLPAALYQRHAVFPSCRHVDRAVSGGTIWPALHLSLQYVAQLA